MRVQWVSLGILFAGVSLVQLQQSNTDKEVSTIKQDPFIGLFYNKKFNFLKQSLRITF